MAFSFQTTGCGVAAGCRSMAAVERRVERDPAMRPATTTNPPRLRSPIIPKYHRQHAVIISTLQAEHRLPLEGPPRATPEIRRASVAPAVHALGGARRRGRRIRNR